MTGEWLQATWGDVVTLQRGFDITKAQQVLEGDVPVVSSGGISSFHNVAAQEGPGVVMGRKGTLGRVFYLDGPYWPHDTTLWVKDFKGNSPRFVYYALLGIDTKSFDVGSSNPTLNRNHVHPLPVRWPSTLAEQERIASVLGAFDDLIETNQRLADHLDDLRRTKVSHALAASSATTRLSEVASFVNGRNFTKGADGAGRPVIRTPEVRSGPGGNTVWSSVVADDDRVARAGDILFVWSGTLLVNRWLYTDGLVNQHVFKVIPKDVPDWYVFALIEAQLPWFLGLAKDKATTMGHIQRAHLDEPMTGLDAHAIASLGPVIEPIWRAALELRLEAQDLTRQRDELLPLLMSGRVRVRDLEAVA